MSPAFLITPSSHPPINTFITFPQPTYKQVFCPSPESQRPAQLLTTPFLSANSTHPNISVPHRPEAYYFPPTRAVSIPYTERTPPEPANMAETTGIKLDPKYDDYDFPVKAPVEQNGHPGYLNEMQQAQVEQLRLMLEAEGYTKRLDTLTLVCFLRRRRLLERADGGPEPRQRMAADLIPV